MHFQLHTPLSEAFFSICQTLNLSFGPWNTLTTSTVLYMFPSNQPIAPKVLHNNIVLCVGINVTHFRGANKACGRFGLRSWALELKISNNTRVFALNSVTHSDKCLCHPRSTPTDPWPLTDWPKYAPPPAQPNSQGNRTLSSSNGLGFMMSWRLGGKGWLTDWLN